MSSRANPGKLRRELRFDRTIVNQNLSSLGLEFDKVKPLISAMNEPNGLLGLHGTELLLLEKVLGLRTEKPAVSLVGELVSVKQVPEGTRVSYGYLSRTTENSNLALVALGFSDGLPRSATNLLRAEIDGRVFGGIGRIAMDQCVFDIGDAKFEVGSEVTLFGEHYSLDALSKDSGFTPLEILGRITARVTRTWVE